MTAIDPQATSKRHWMPGITCPICGEQIRLFQWFNWDHVIPVSLGGRRGGVQNRRLAHVACNTAKGNRYPFSLRTPEERQWLKDVVNENIWNSLNAVWSGQPDS